MAAKPKRTRVQSHLSGVLSIRYFDDGDICQSGEPLCEIELMKTQHRINAPLGGTVKFVAELGGVIAEGDTICWITALGDDEIDLTRVDKVP